MWRATGLGRDLNPRPQERRMTDKRMLVCLVATPAAMGAALSAHHSHAVLDSQNRNAVTQ
jgi:hypothetical protein